MKTFILTAFSMFILSLPCLSAVPLSIGSENIQLQQLIEKSAEQIKALKEILSYKKQDEASLNKANEILEKLTMGIDESIEKYQGSEAYEKALLDVQAKDDFKNTYSESKKLRDQSPKKDVATEMENKKAFDENIQFQKDSVRANQTDLKYQQQMQQDLQTAGPGFVPKLQAQAQLGNWKSGTRVSTQMTALLAEIAAIREELRIMRLNQQGSDALSVFISGSEIQNQKLKEGSRK